MVLCKTALSVLLMHWRYCSLALSSGHVWCYHPYRMGHEQHLNLKVDMDVAFTWAIMIQSYPKFFMSRQLGCLAFHLVKGLCDHIPNLVKKYIDGLGELKVALAMELLQSCTKPLIESWWFNLVTVLLMLWQLSSNFSGVFIRAYEVLCNENRRLLDVKENWLNMLTVS